MTGDEVLALPMTAKDVPGVTTIRGYLVALLATLWDENDGFSGKRPFGNSGWQWDLMTPLAHAGLVDVTFDEDGDLDVVSVAAEAEFDRLIRSAIDALGQVPA